MAFAFPHDSLTTLKTCLVTGLPILSRPGWTNRGFGSAYRLTTRVIGDRILLNQSSGVAELQDIIDSLELTETVIQKQHIDTSNDRGKK